ncbi:hypothetical protein JTE90_013350 [Oedothorax gibbosus]|uniref:Uncharacterized protein n=1 Tax=Oedothorax gibbosus TaxID=931172 RepID=A0AAV6TVP7_9ARAC|nr:hypothetical protein JTE90_013350 [Oedothorax gibbosus]
MATVHQLAQCSAWIGEAFETPYKQLTSEEEILVSSSRSRDLLIEAGFSDDSNIKVARTAVYSGTDYRQNLFVCVQTSSESNLNPSFGKIEELLLIKG